MLMELPTAQQEGTGAGGTAERELKLRWAVPLALPRKATAAAGV